MGAFKKNKNMDTIEIEVKVNTTIDVPLGIGFIINQINVMPITRRWNVIANILNGIESPITELNDEQREIIKMFLAKKIELYKSKTTAQ